VRDVLFVLISVGFFAVAGLYVKACARIVGTDDAQVEVEPVEPLDAPKVAA
jgi:hypothetical protein